MALVNWIDHGDSKISIDVYPNSQISKEVVFTSVTKPDPIRITAVGKDTNAPLLLDSKTMVTVSPKETKEMVTIKIGEGI